MLEDDDPSLCLNVTKESQQLVHLHQNTNDELSSPKSVAESDTSGPLSDYDYVDYDLITEPEYLTFDEENSRKNIPYYIEVESDAIYKEITPEHKSCLHQMEVQNDEIYTDPVFKISDVENSSKDPAMKEGSGYLDNLDRLSPEPERSLSPDVEVTTCFTKASLKTEPISKVSKPNQKEEFFQYSVSETSECLKVCGLVEFAEKCQENKLDGSFFRNMDLEILKEEPFNLLNFHIVMFNKIIFEGWRPKV